MYNYYILPQLYASLDGDVCHEVSAHFNILTVPTVIFTDHSKNEIKRFENEDPLKVIEAAEDYLNKFKINF